MATIPLELIFIIIAALLTRTLNRRPAVWERFVVGLKTFAAPSARDIAVYLKTSARAALDYAKGTTPALEKNAAERAEELLNPLTRTVPFSFPHVNPDTGLVVSPNLIFPWHQIVGEEAAIRVGVSLLYMILGLLFAGPFEILTGKNNPYLDFLLVTAAALALAGPAQNLVLLFLRNVWTRDGWVSWFATALAFVASMALLHSKPAFLTAFVGAPMTYALGDLAASSASGAGAGGFVDAADAALAASAGVDESSAAAAAGGNGDGVSTYLLPAVIALDAPAAPANNSIAGVTAAISAVLAIAVGLLFMPLFRVAKLHSEAQKAYVSLPPSNTRKSSSNVMRTTLSFVAPLLTLLLLVGPGLGDGRQLGLVPADAVPCCDAAVPSYQCPSVMRDCRPDASASSSSSSLAHIPFRFEMLTARPSAAILGGNAVTPFLSFSLGGANGEGGRYYGFAAQMPESTWIAARLVLLLALSVFQILAVRDWLQQHLLSGKANQVSHLVSAAATAAKMTSQKEAEKVQQQQGAGGNASSAAAASSSRGGSSSGNSGLVSGAVVIASDGKEYPAGTVYDLGVPSLLVTDVPMSQGAVDMVRQSCQVEEVVAGARVAMVATDLLAPPVATTALGILMLRRVFQFGPLLQEGLCAASTLVHEKLLGESHSFAWAPSKFCSAAAAAAAASAVTTPASLAAAAAEVAAAPKSAAAALKLSTQPSLFASGGLFDPATVPWTRILYGPYAQLVLLYSLQFIALASSVLLLLLAGYIIYVAPGLASISTASITNKAGSVVGKAVAAGITAATGSGAKGKEKEKEDKKRK